MKKVFLDSSIIISASASIYGASAYILGLGRTRQIEVYVSLEVLRESKKNIESKLDPDCIKRFLYYSQLANLRLEQEADIESIRECQKYIHTKDAPILAAAIKSPAEYIITLDRKHFLQKEVEDFVKPKIISSPGDFVRNYKL